LTTAHRELAQHLLQLGDVAGHQGDEVVHLARHQVGRDHLGHRAQHLLEGVAGPGVVPGERRRDVDRQREARRGRVEPGRDDPDDPGLLEVPDPVQRGRRGQAHRPGQVDVCNICIRLE
jgi:hypothetical protein